MAQVSQTTELAVVKRRPVGKGAWKLTINELLESERSDLAKLRRLRSKFGSDAEALGILIELYEGKTERLISLQELMHYREPSEGVSVNGNGGVNAGD